MTDESILFGVVMSSPENRIESVSFFARFSLSLSLDLSRLLFCGRLDSHPADDPPLHVHCRIIILTTRATTRPLPAWSLSPKTPTHSLVHSKSISVLSHLNTAVPLRVSCTHTHTDTHMHLYRSKEGRL